MVYMSLYPNIINVKTSDVVINLLTIISEVVCILSVILNAMLTPNFKWSFIVILGIVYSWITVMYSIKKTVNIASHVLLQTFIDSIVVILLDLIIGYKGWAIAIAWPIIICTENITMLVLTIVTRKKYFKYAIYQIMLFALNTLLIAVIAINNPHKILPISLTSITSVITLVLAIELCGKELKEELKRFFHV